MNNPLLRVIIALGIVTTAAGCVNEPIRINGTWKCFTVNDTDPPPPHADEADAYCIDQRSDMWYLVPGEGMDDWKAIGGGTDIPLTVRTNRPRVKSWDFEVEIEGHPTPPATDHGPQHVKPDRGYRLQVNIPVDPTAKSRSTIRVAGPRGDPIHGGTAHGVED